MQLLDATDELLTSTFHCTSSTLLGQDLKGPEYLDRAILYWQRLSGPNVEQVLQIDEIIRTEQAACSRIRAGWKTANPSPTPETLQ